MSVFTLEALTAIANGQDAAAVLPPETLESCIVSMQAREGKATTKTRKRSKPLPLLKLLASINAGATSRVALLRRLAKRGVRSRAESLYRLTADNFARTTQKRQLIAVHPLQRAACAKDELSLTCFAVRSGSQWAVASYAYGEDPEGDSRAVMLAPDISGLVNPSTHYESRHVSHVELFTGPLAPRNRCFPRIASDEVTPVVRKVDPREVIAALRNGAVSGMTPEKAFAILND